MTLGAGNLDASESVAEHRERVLASIRPLEPTTVTLAEALGHTLAANLVGP